MRIGFIKSFTPFTGLVPGLIFMLACNSNNSNKSYSGSAYKDQVYKEGVQIIPGKLQCEFYDFGGEGIAFHDSDSTNSGSGALNKADGSYLHELRLPEC